VSAPRLPGFDGHRPKFLDRPLSGFDAAVNLTVLNGERALRAIIARAMHPSRRPAKPRLRSSK
jgi:hypothetical protein